MAQPDIDGALVGGASLKADSFAALVQCSVNFTFHFPNCCVN